MGLLAQAAEPADLVKLLDRLEKAADKADATGMIYLFILVIIAGGVGGFFLLRYMLSHAREIHSEANKTLIEHMTSANKTLLEISNKHEARCSALTDTFSKECKELRQVLLRVTSDARDMVHATRDIAYTAVTGKELLEMYRKEEEAAKARQDRETSTET